MFDRQAGNVGRCGAQAPSFSQAVPRSAPNTRDPKIIPAEHMWFEDADGNAAPGYERRKELCDRRRDMVNGTCEQQDVIGGCGAGQKLP